MRKQCNTNEDNNTRTRCKQAISMAMIYILHLPQKSISCFTYIILHQARFADCNIIIYNTLFIRKQANMIDHNLCIVAYFPRYCSCFELI